MLLHHESLAEFGGACGVRDEGALEAALTRARNKWAYGEGRSAVAELAAAYAYGLARGHPFVDGNKRVAFLAIGLFLALNGCRLIVDKVEAVHVMVAIADGTLDEAGLASWVHRHIDASRAAK
jgi:death-on-curing protein